MNREEKSDKTRTGAGGAAMLEQAKEQGRPIISPAAEATEAGEDPEGFASEPLDGEALTTVSRDAGSTKPTGAMFWLGLAILGGAAWYLLGKKKKGRKKKTSRRK